MCALETSVVLRSNMCGECVCVLENSLVLRLSVVDVYVGELCSLDVKHASATRTRIYGTVYFK